ncbi:MAG TPA: ABC transporter permease [Anaerolineaceae bacterium]|nr:ABC transporter permease [Anaerolineaceae bacterium]
MRFFDLLSLIAYNLGRRKGRVVLTGTGVLIGTAAVIILVSLATGMQRSATSQLGGIGDLTLIHVYPNWEMMGNGGSVAVSVGGGGGGGGGGASQPKQLTPSALKEIAALPGVASVVPFDYMQASATIKYGKLETWANIMGAGTSDLSIYEYKLMGGTLKLDRGTIIVSEVFFQNFYDPTLRPGQTPPETPDPMSMIGKSVKLVLSKWSSDGTETRKTIKLRIAGVIPESRGETDYMSFMNMDDLNAINEWARGQRINRNKEGYQDVRVKVDEMDNVLDVAEQINQMGFMASAAQSYVQGINSFFMVLQIIFGGVGAVALLVAAIGIANTMTMAILERTREIGLMKAIGATNNNVLSVFLGEAAGIGFLGGIGGVLIGWGGGKILNIVAYTYLVNQSQGGMPPSLAVYTPVWLPLFAMGFATLVGLLSGLYPALRAATLVPVTALKYE